MIREATAADIPDLVRMGLAFIRSSPYAALVPERPEQIAAFVGELMIGDVGKIFVSATEATVTGVIILLSFRQPFTGQMTVSELAWWVDPEARGGQGIRLLQKAEKWAASIGATWFQMTAPTIEVGRLYERLGYQAVEVCYQRSVA